MQRWLKEGNKTSAAQRDVFIVDEDIVLSQCYKPPRLDKNEIEAFLKVTTKFIRYFDDGEEINDKIRSLFGQIALCDTTSFIRPADPDFRFPGEIVAEWDEEIASIYKVTPNDDGAIYPVGNHLQLIEDALRYGVVVQKFNNRHRVYFNNRLSFDLSKAPPHVFFDGTMIDEIFLKKKLPGVQLVRHRIDIDPLWDARVFQNINSSISI